MVNVLMSFLLVPVNPGFNVLSQIGLQVSNPPVFGVTESTKDELCYCCGAVFFQCCSFPINTNGSN